MKKALQTGLVLAFLLSLAPTQAAETYSFLSVQQTLPGGSSQISSKAIDPLVDLLQDTKCRYLFSGKRAQEPKTLEHILVCPVSELASLEGLSAQKDSKLKWKTVGQELNLLMRPRYSGEAVLRETLSSAHAFSIGTNQWPESEIKRQKIFFISFSPRHQAEITQAFAQENRLEFGYESPSDPLVNATVLIALFDRNSTYTFSDAGRVMDDRF
jgi:hypothetical protein